ncbi:tRNA (adenosine(37)-N6)-dimethylallyltransferase MiaA [Eubacteriales bacterium OttesenSCG-928-A19]|nr:tRNA (adenosine(37)-N6)-dimethylallyltransferase MiaA [Eubacteriales bacterium OttesenSCG-928-A19]
MIREKQMVVCITGPTASGKSAAAVTASQALGGEVLSMDSMQVYRGLCVGTAKPSTLEMGGVPHHLLSYIPPDASYSVAEYQRDAREELLRIFRRGNLPVFCGGTGLFLRAVCHPLRFTGAGGETAIRAQLQEEAAQPDGPQALLSRLAVVDPQSARHLHANNTRRVIRALEVYISTGIPMSEQRGEWDAEPEEDWHIFALNWPRETLYARINARVDKMISAGLIQEVENLLHQGVPKNAQAMQAIGYKEIISMLDGECTRAEAIEAIKMNTRRYAKRQLTWLRRDERIVWLNLETYRNEVEAHKDLTRRIQAIQEARNAAV